MFCRVIRRVVAPAVAVAAVLGFNLATGAAPPPNQPFTGGFHPLFGSPGTVGAAASASYPQPGVYGGMIFNPFNAPGIPLTASSGETFRLPETNPADVAHFEVKLPENAQLTVDGHPTRKTGAVRHFVSPALLEPGKTYHYTFRAQWPENGQTVTRERTVEFQMGSRQTVDLTRPDAPPARP
jgi:uncharacterized protein (TIGR03000 family)